MPSGAGLNRGGLLGGLPLLSLTSNVTAYTTPLVGYGTIGVNDSGWLLHSLAGFTKWRFSIIGAGANTAGYTVAIYGTLDPALLNYVYNVGPTSGLPMDLCARTAIPASSSTLLDDPSVQSGTGTVANPMVTGSATTLAANSGWYAVRAVLIATATPTLPITVLASAVP